MPFYENNLTWRKKKDLARERKHSEDPEEKTPKARGDLNSIAQIALYGKI